MIDNAEPGWTVFTFSHPAERVRVFVDGLEWPEGMSEADFKKYHDDWFEQHEMRG